MVIRTVLLGVLTLGIGSFATTSAALGLTPDGIPAVLITGRLVRSLPLSVLRWMIVLIVVHAAIMMLMSAILHRNETEAT